MIDEKCRCNCHNNRGGIEVRHMGPCCLKCHFCSIYVPVSAVSAHKKRCALDNVSVFATELEYFEQYRIEWCEGYIGKFALIKGTTLHGFFDTYNLALSAGYKIRSLNIDPFLIKEVQMRDRVLDMTGRIVIDLFNGIQDDYVI